jgi:prepilin-type N-terminal cleavage/methylation domain-containing protein
MRRHGFTTIEMIIVVVMIGIIAVIGFPKIRRALDKTNVRSTRVFLGTAVATARAAAVQRGCRTAVHFSSGMGTVWVTACSRANPAAIDTIGGVADLASRYNVTLVATNDSIQFDPRGLSMTNATTTVRITGATSYGTDSVLVNQLGRVVR